MIQVVVNKERKFKKFIVSDTDKKKDGYFQKKFSGFAVSSYPVPIFQNLVWDCYKSVRIRKIEEVDISCARSFANALKFTYNNVGISDSEELQTLHRGFLI